MSNIRQSAVAGMFYPGNPKDLDSTVKTFLNHARKSDSTPRAIIVPHAGYVYSGQVAAQAYKSLEPISDSIRRVVLLGPSHRVPFYGCALSSADYFATPLGNIPIDTSANAALIQAGLARTMDEAHALEHSLEVQLPFLQEVLSEFKLVPIVVGEAEAEEIAAILDFFWEDKTTLFVISSDLSHYHPYEEAVQRDGITTESILHFNSVSSHQACGCKPVNGLLVQAKKHHLSARLLELKNSGDTAGSKDQVVGYGAYAFYE